MGYCLKYNHNQLNKNFINLFIEKLKEKKQTEQQQKQAFHAISLYYELGLIGSQKDGLLKDKNQNLSIKKEGLRLRVRLLKRTRVRLIFNFCHEDTN